MNIASVFIVTDDRLLQHALLAFYVANRKYLHLYLRLLLRLPELPPEFAGAAIPDHQPTSPSDSTNQNAIMELATAFTALSALPLTSTATPVPQHGKSSVQAHTLSLLASSRCFQGPTTAPPLTLSAPLPTTRLRTTSTNAIPSVKWLEASQVSSVLLRLMGIRSASVSL